MSYSIFVFMLYFTELLSLIPNILSILVFACIIHFNGPIIYEVLAYILICHTQRFYIILSKQDFENLVILLIAVTKASDFTLLKKMVYKMKIDRWPSEYNCVLFIPHSHFTPIILSREPILCKTIFKSLHKLSVSQGYLVVYVCACVCGVSEGGTAH